MNEIKSPTLPTADKMQTVFSAVLLAISTLVLAICSAIDLGVFMMRVVFPRVVGYGGASFNQTLNNLEAVNALLVGVLMIIMICAVVAVLHNRRRERRASVILGIITVGECLFAMIATVLGTNLYQFISLTSLIMPV